MNSKIKEHYCDLQSCCSVQPRRSYSPASKAAKNLAEELLVLLNYDRVKAEAILRELVLLNPERPIEWYYEIAVHNLHQRKQR